MKRNEHARVATVIGVTMLLTTLIAGCTEEPGFNNPIDPENPSSPLAAPVGIIEPIIGSDYYISNLEIPLIWAPVDGATRYEYFFATTPSPEAFPDQVIGSGETQSTQAGPFFLSSTTGTYYFGVRYQAVVSFPEGAVNAWGPWYTGWCTISGDGTDGTLPSWTIGTWTSLFSRSGVHGVTIFDGGGAWMVDQNVGATGGIVQLDQTGAVISTVSHPGNPTGLANDGTDLYVADDSEGAIYRVATDGAFSNLLISGLGDATGLTYAWDRGSLFLASFEDDGKIYEIRVSDGSIIQSFSSPSNGPEGLTYDAPYLWHVDIYTSRLYLIDPDSHAYWEVAQLSGDQSVPIGLALPESGAAEELYLVSESSGILSVAPIIRSGGSTGGGGTIVDGVAFPAGASTVVEFSVPDTVFGGLGYWHFEPLFYRADNNAELDSMTSLEGDLSTLPMTAAPIIPDGDLSDWGGITPYITDPVGDEEYPAPPPGSDLVAVYLAQEPDGALAVAFELADNTPNVDNIYAFHMNDSAGFGFGSPGFYVTHDGSGWSGISVY